MTDSSSVGTMFMGQELSNYCAYRCSSTYRADAVLTTKPQNDGLVQERRNYNTLAMESHFSCHRDAYYDIFGCIIITVILNRLYWPDEVISNDQRDFGKLCVNSRFILGLYFACINHHSHPIKNAEHSSKRPHIIAYMYRGDCWNDWT